MSDPHSALIHALEVAQVAEDDDRDTPERACVRKSLAGVMDYLRATGVPTRLRAPFQHLYAALDDIAEGRSNELLTPAPMTVQAGVPKKRSFERMEMAAASAAVTILKQDVGMSLKVAVARVARVIDVQPSTLAEYRKNITAGRVSQDVRDSYDDWRQMRRRDYPNMTPAEFVDRMLQTAGDLSKIV